METIIENHNWTQGRDLHIEGSPASSTSHLHLYIYQQYHIYIYTYIIYITDTHIYTYIIYITHTQLYLYHLYHTHIYTYIIYITPTSILISSISHTSILTYIIYITSIFILYYLYIAIIFKCHQLITYMHTYMYKYINTICWLLLIVYIWFQDRSLCIGQSVMGLIPEEDEFSHFSTIFSCI